MVRLSIGVFGAHLRKGFYPQALPCFATLATLRFDCPFLS
jgi:hypothetical protein